jgi:hypothetical protein
MSYDGLAQAGVLGVVLAWFMLRLEGILTQNTLALNALTMVIQKLVSDSDGKTSS